MAMQESLRILIVDDEPATRLVMERALAQVGYVGTVEANSAEAARRVLAGATDIALVLLDLRMPGEGGLRLLEDLAPRAPGLVTMVISGVQEFEVAVEALKHGAYDYVVKPFNVEALQLAVGRTLKRRQTELAERDHARRVTREVEARISVLERTRGALLRAMCLMAEFGDTAAVRHLDRVGRLAVLLAEELALRSPYAPMVDGAFLADLGECAALHDIGKVALPDAIRLKPGTLTAEETLVMQRHTTVGWEICRYVQESLTSGQDELIRMAADVAHSHHENWDGTGYPRGLKGAAIPLSARIVGLTDLYEVCCSPTVYRPQAMDPSAVAAMVGALSGVKFDPVVAAAFRTCRPAFDEVVAGAGS